MHVKYTKFVEETYWMCKWAHKCKWCWKVKV